jgi:outer membrane lipoprotein carrier protein
MKKGFLTLSFLTLLFSQAFSFTAEELSLKIEQKYKSLKDISMSFTQITKSEVFSTEKETPGRMYLKNPDKFRIDTPSQSIVTDGKLLWLFSERNKQVTIHKLKESKNVFKPHDYIYNFRTNYEPELERKEKIDKKICYKLVLTPKEENLFITSLILWIDEKTLLVKKLEYQDINDNWVSFLFHKIKINSDLKDKRFVYTPPEGIEVVDLTE